MKTLTDEKLTIVGAAGMIGSNMAQTVIIVKFPLISSLLSAFPFSFHSLSFTWASRSLHKTSS